MSELILHLFGDYVTQSDWMATEKTKRHLPALAHAVVYSLPFLLLGPSPVAFAVIFCTHFLIDRFRLARYVCWAKNWLAPFRWVDLPEAEDWKKHPYATSPNGPVPPIPFAVYRPTLPWRYCTATGYPPDRPAWLAVWLMIAADNTLHLAINHMALRYL